MRCRSWRSARRLRFGGRSSGASSQNGQDEKGEPYENLRWSRFKNFVGPEMFESRRRACLSVPAHAQRPRRRLCHAHARRTLPNPEPAASRQGRRQARQARDGRPRHQGRRLRIHAAEIATAGQNGQFRTPRHVIAIMVELTQPKPEDVICDPAAGTCGFLVAAGEYLRKQPPGAVPRRRAATHFHTKAYSTASISTRPCCASAP